MPYAPACFAAVIISPIISLLHAMLITISMLLSLILPQHILLAHIAYHEYYTMNEMTFYEQAYEGEYNTIYCRC